MNLKSLGVIAFIALTLTGCGKKDFSKMNFKDGTYIGNSKGGEHTSYTEVHIVIKDNKIIKSSAEFRDSDKNLKDENYGKKAGEEKYIKAQKAVKAMNEYPEILLKVQDPEKVDAVAGATHTNELYKKAVWNALEKAKR